MTPAPPHPEHQLNKDCLLCQHPTCPQRTTTSNAYSVCNDRRPKQVPMTPAPSHPEYLFITETDITGYCIAVVNSDCDLFDRITDIIRIRSRSHSTTPSEREKVIPILEALVKAFYQYEMDVMDPEFSIPYIHRNMMEKAENLIKELRTTTEAHR